MHYHKPLAPIMMQTYEISSGLREFVLIQKNRDGRWEPLYSSDILGLDHTALRIGRLAKRNKFQAQVLALCRLLIPCLKVEGKGRHMVAEGWSRQDLDGKTIAQDTGTLFAQDLDEAQAQEAHEVRLGRKPVVEGLTQLLWETHTKFDPLTQDIYDPELAVMAKDLYEHLVPAGDGFEELSVQDIREKVASRLREGFEPQSSRERRRQLKNTFKKLLALSIRWASILTGSVATDIIKSGLSISGQAPLTREEAGLVAFRYGARKEFGNMNIEFLVGNGAEEARVLDEYYLALISRSGKARCREILQRLRRDLYLLRGFRTKRNAARAQKVKEKRDLKMKGPKLPTGVGRPEDGELSSTGSSLSAKTSAAEGTRDPKAQDPLVSMVNQEELAIWVNRLKEGQLKLKPRDRKRFLAYWKHKGDRAAAAKALGVRQGAFSRQLRRTTLPNIRRAIESQKEHQ